MCRLLYEGTKQKMKTKTETELRIIEQQNKLKQVIKFLNENCVYSMKHYKIQESLRFVIKGLDQIELSNNSEWV